MCDGGGKVGGRLKKLGKGEIWREVREKEGGGKV